MKTMNIDQVKEMLTYVWRGGGFYIDDVVCKECQREHGGEAPCEDFESCILDFSETIDVFIQAYENGMLEEV